MQVFAKFLIVCEKYTIPNHLIALEHTATKPVGFFSVNNPSYIRSLRRGLMHMIFNFFQNNEKNSSKSLYFELKLFFDVKIVYNMVKLSKSIWIPSPHFPVLY